MSALNGLTLIQNIRHPSSHTITVRDLDSNEFEGVECHVNSIHHQIPWTNNKLEGKNFKVYGYTQLSPIHEYQEDEKITCFIEPEIIHFPKTNSIGVQFHPEMMGTYGSYKDIQSYLERLINKLF